MALSTKETTLTERLCLNLLSCYPSKRKLQCHEKANLLFPVPDHHSSSVDSQKYFTGSGNDFKSCSRSGDQTCLPSTRIRLVRWLLSLEQENEQARLDRWLLGKATIS